MDFQKVSENLRIELTDAAEVRIIFTCRTQYEAAALYDDVAGEAMSKRGIVIRGGNHE